MRIQLDTINKTITIEEDVNLHDFYEEINGLLPSGLWREYTLKITKITEWKDPITWDPSNPMYHPFPGQPSPGIFNPVWCSTTSNSDNGIFNFEM